MKLAITTQPGKPEVIKIKERPIPKVKKGWVLIKIMAFGINRSEIFTRIGDSPNVRFPIVQGIECVGIVEKDLSGKLKVGQQVAAIMGGMGRDFDGSYAEYTLVPEHIIFPFSSSLNWNILGAIPEMFQTVSGSLHQALEIAKNEILLIRGGTSSIGMLACQLAKSEGLKVISTTRKINKKDALIKNGSDHVVIDDGNINNQIRNIFPNGVDKVLELIGTKTLKDSLKCIKKKGIVCMTGILGSEWTMNNFTPMGDIPSLGRLTVYMGDVENLEKSSLQGFINAVEKNKISVNLDKVFSLDEIVNAHKYMENNHAKGKIVVKC